MKVVQILRRISVLNLRRSYVSRSLVHDVFRIPPPYSIIDDTRLSTIRSCHTQSAVASQYSIPEVLRTIVEANMCNTYVLTELFNQVLVDEDLTLEQVREIYQLLTTDPRSQWLNCVLELAATNGLKRFGNSLVEQLIKNPEILKKHVIPPYTAFLKYVLKDYQYSEFTKLVANFIIENETKLPRVREIQALYRTLVSLQETYNVHDDCMNSKNMTSVLLDTTPSSMKQILYEIYNPDRDSFSSKANVAVIDDRFSAIINALKQRGFSIDNEVANVIGSWWELIPSSNRKVGTDVMELPRCKQCGGRLEVNSVSPIQLDIVRKDFFKDLLCDADRMYVEDKNYEYMKYLDFLSRFESRPFDCIVDLENMIYRPTMEDRIQRYQEFESLLFEICKRYNLNNVLLISKLVQRRLPFSQSRDEFGYRGIDLFYYKAPSLSKDDFFLIDAACWADAFIVSSDRFRQHRALLQHKDIFERWLGTRQIFVNLDRRSFRLTDWVKNEIQGSEDGWHIPFVDKRVDDTNDSNRRWLCLQK